MHVQENTFFGVKYFFFFKFLIVFAKRASKRKIFFVRLDINYLNKQYYENIREA